MSQMRLILLVAVFITLTSNFTFFEQAILIFPLVQNFLFVSSLIIWLFTFLSAQKALQIDWILNILTRLMSTQFVTLSVETKAC